MLKNIDKTIFLIIYFFLIEIKQVKINFINLVNFFKQLKLIPYFMMSILGSENLVHAKNEFGLNLNVFFN